MSIDAFDLQKCQKVWNKLAEDPNLEENLLTVLKKLRKDYELSEASLIVAQALLHKKALRKFPPEMVSKMLFLEEALEQATAWPLAQHRAQMLNECAKEGPFLDLGCGLGSDSLALAHYREVMAYDLDKQRLNCLVFNSQALNLPVSCFNDDYLKAELPQAGAIFADPARRVKSGKRVLAAEEAIPPLSEIMKLSGRLQLPTAVKLAPSFDKSQLKLYPGASLEFVGTHKECREAVLWLNLPTPAFCQASLLQKDGTWFMERLPAQAENDQVETGPLKSDSYLYELEPVLLRAGFLKIMACKLKAHLFDPQVSWLISESFEPTPLAEAFKITEVGHFTVKKLQKRLQELEIGILEIKKRNSAVEPDILRRKLHLTEGSSKSATVFITRQMGKPTFMLAERL